MFSIQHNKDSASQEKCSDTLNVCFTEFIAYNFSLNTNKHKANLWICHESYCSSMCNEMLRPGTQIHLPEPPADSPSAMHISTQILP